MKEERWTYSALARRINVPRAHLVNVMMGCAHPSTELRERLPVVLGKPIEELLSAESLAKPYTGPRPGRPKAAAK